MKIRRTVNIIIAIMVPAAWLMMAFGGEGTLSENGLSNLKYFTVLSNILEGISAVVWLRTQNSDKETRDKAETFKFVAAVCVGLTFTVVMCFFGPLYGYISMIRGANFFFHLLIPVIALTELIFLTDRQFTMKENNLTVLPPLVYGLVYIANVLINGVGEWPDTNDWYLFLTWGFPVGILIFACICLAAWLLALLMRKLQKKVIDKRRRIFVEKKINIDGCGSKAAESRSEAGIIGSWQSQESMDVFFDFEEGGVGSFDVKGTAVSITYEDDGSLLKITYEGVAEVQVWAYVIEGDKLTMTDQETGQVVTYMRA